MFIVKPVTVIGLDAPVAVTPPGLDVTVNDVGVDPVTDGVNVTDAVVEDKAVAVPIVGALGFVGHVPAPMARNCCLRVNTPLY